MGEILILLISLLSFRHQRQGMEFRYWLDLAPRLQHYLFGRIVMSSDLKAAGHPWLIRRSLSR